MDIGNSKNYLGILKVTSIIVYFQGEQLVLQDQSISKTPGRGDFDSSVCALSHSGEWLALAAELAGRQFAIMVRLPTFWF